MAVTVQVSRLRTGSPLVVTSRRSLRRVATTSPMPAVSPPAIGVSRWSSRWPASRRAVWTAWLMASTWSLVDGDDGDGAPGVVVVDPGRGEPVEVVVEGAGDDAAVGLVGVERLRVAGSELQGCGGFPGVGEAVQASRAVRRGRWRTARRTGHRGRRPAAVVGRRRGPVASRFRSASVTTWWRAGVDSMPASSTISVVPAGSWYSGSGGRSVRWCSWRSLATVSAGDAGVALDGSGRLGGRRHREHDTAVRAEVVGGGLEHAGLAGAGRADHEHEPVAAGHRCGGVGLQRIETVAVDRAWTVSAGRLGRPSPT